MWGSRFNNNTHWFIDISKIYHILGKYFCESVPACHAFSGCDYTSEFMRKGKLNLSVNFTANQSAKMLTNCVTKYSLKSANYGEEDPLKNIIRFSLQRFNKNSSQKSLRYEGMKLQNEMMSWKVKCDWKNVKYYINRDINININKNKNWNWKKNLKKMYYVTFLCIVQQILQNLSYDFSLICAFIIWSRSTVRRKNILILLLFRQHPNFNKYST